jgi:hypothetical protein
MTLQNIATDVNALITTDNASPPKFQLNNVQALADAINAGVTTPTYTRNVSAVNVPLYAVATAPVQLAPSRSSRVSCFIHNPSANPLRVAFAATAGAPIHVVVSALGTLTLNESTFPWTGAIWGISHNGNGYQVIVGEVY